MKIRALLLALALGACVPVAEKEDDAPATPAAPDPMALNIEIGRYGVMLDQVHELTAPRSGPNELDPTTPGELARALRETVWAYNRERSALCAKGLFREVACGPAYEPVWISETPALPPTLEEIESRSRAVGEEVTRFWGAVCEDARSRAESDEERFLICAIE